MPLNQLRFPLILLAFLLLASPLSAGAAASPLLKTILTNYGGADKISPIRNITAKGQIADLRKGKEGPYRSYLARDRRFRSEALVTPSSSGDVRILQGDKGWKNSGLTLNTLQGSDLTALIAQYEALAFPLTFLNPAISLNYEAPAVVHDHPVETYTIKLPNTQPLTVYLDAISMLVHRVEWPGQNNALLALEYTDYRFVDGVLLPFRIVSYAADIKVAEITLASITLNEQLPASLFKP